MRIHYYHYDAFTDHLFGGNPAGVCSLDRWLDDGVMQRISAENRLPETAFCVPEGDGYRLRWFTPETEIDLCGHGTLATAQAIFSFIEPGRERVTFETLSGSLSVERNGDLLSMDFPARPPKPVDAPGILADALGCEPRRVLASRDLMAVFDREEDISGMIPDMAKIRQITDWFAVIVTAPGNTADFVSRFFAPNAGIDEDPATGSAHCELTPYWAERLGKSSLVAYQLSSRGAVLHCEDCGDRARISGTALLYSFGEIFLPG